jgi:hypothetical protein
MTKRSEPSLPINPTHVASELGAQRSSWHRLGDGPWFGTVVDAGGLEWEFEELRSARSWRATSSAAQTFNASSLEQLLHKVLDGRS